MHDAATTLNGNERSLVSLLDKMKRIDRARAVRSNSSICFKLGECSRKTETGDAMMNCDVYIIPVDNATGFYFLCAVHLCA